MGDATLWALIALVLFLGLLVKMGVPGKIADALDNRAKAIEDELDQARRLREEAQALLAEFQRKARESESEAEEIVTLAKREAEAMEKEAHAKITEYVARRTKQAEDKIAQAESQAVSEVKSAATDLAIEAAKGLLTSKLAGKGGRDLLKASIAEVGTKLN
ncbi:ATP F0F1 synthase subunit B [Cohaesibacter celericrescens]|jgi:F-type H+-transporting ATPase subunit b|uniref:ATP synthase subunit b n=1 Tax=Cohaesibacter celericrescens TaxID=2067669 RepID=A0A2N5XV84_9HYPH|nr:ATP F0F1 synthase subunit B [Cohaesibacter celericrescens]PLW78421.1 ATP F0F1 synthase subunit B [Cohaesibacter celericrescens]